MGNIQKLFIKNRQQQRIALVYTEVDAVKGLAFIQDGLSGYKEQPHIQVMADAFHENGISTVNFDATCSFGESDGILEDITLTSHANDLADVIGWSSSQPWYREPFYLAGHSLGGASTLVYASSFPERVRGIVPASAVVSGKLYVAKFQEDELSQRKITGRKEKVSSQRPDLKGYIGYGYIEDVQQYNFLESASAMTMPLLAVVGSHDDSTPPVHQKMLYDVWGGKKLYREIEGSEHTFRTPNELVALKLIVSTWLSEL